MILTVLIQVLSNLFTTDACKYYIQLERGQIYSLNQTNVEKGCQYEFLTRNKFVINAQCKVEACGSKLSLGLSKEGHFLNPDYFLCQKVINETSHFQRLTLLPKKRIEIPMFFEGRKVP